MGKQDVLETLRIRRERAKVREAMQAAKTSNHNALKGKP